MREAGERQGDEDKSEERKRGKKYGEGSVQGGGNNKTKERRARG